METKVNIQYKDRLFRLIFGSKEMRGNIISLYNAINGTNHSEEDEFEITTLDDAIYIKMKNDISLLIDSYLSLWEQQSSFNPNMPLRGFMYFGSLYDSHIKIMKYNIYGSTLVKIPTPRYVVFYNGKEDRPPVEKLKLSSAFINPQGAPEFEWTATVYNLNKGKNDKLLHDCKPLADYMTLVNYIRDNQKKGMPIEDAVDKAVVRCIKENVLADFLIKHRAEVLNVCITEYDEETFTNGIREEGRREGIKEGKAAGEDKLSKLIQLLISENRTEDIKLATSDAQKREELYKEFEITI